MIEIGINPNTKVASVVIVLRSYFGLGKDGIKLVDQDTVFEAEKITKAGEVPTDAFSVQKLDPIKLGENLEKTGKDERGRFTQGHRYSVGNNGGRPSKTPITDHVKEVLEFKHYKKKDGTDARAMELFAESLVDRAILQGNGKAIDTIYERVEGKVTQGVKLSGGLSHGTPDDEEVARMTALFPDKK